MRPLLPETRRDFPCYSVTPVSAALKISSVRIHKLSYNNFSVL